MSLPDFQRLLDPAVQAYLRVHEQEDVQQWLLKGRSLPGIAPAVIAAQLSARSKARTKLPSWYARENIVYPPSVSLEQCSSEATALFKSELLHGMCHSTTPRGADLTAGMGVDAWAFSRWADVTCLEPQKDLQEITAHNLAVMGAQAHWIDGQAEDFHEKENAFDFIYVDPSRRNDQRKVFKLEDCSPDVTLCLPSWLRMASVVLIKASPLLDIARAVTQLQHVRDVWVVSVNNECKELLLVVQAGWREEPLRHAVDVDPSGKPMFHFSFTASAERDCPSHVGSPKRYVYEPCAAVLKAGAFKSVGEAHGLIKLSADSHLYTHDEYIPAFPGRAFLISGVEKLDGTLHRKFERGFANIISRNHPLSVAEIMKKSGLREGGTSYLICTRAPEGPLVLRGEVVRDT